MIWSLIIFCLLAMWPAQATVSEAGSGLLYGPDYSYWLTAPAGWVLDNQAGVSQGCHAVFYPKGSSWEHSPVVMYGNARHFTPTERTAGEMARADIVEFHSDGSPGYKGEFSENMKLLHERTAEVWPFQGDKWGNLEAIAYVTEKKSVDFVVLNAQNREEFDEAWPSFLKLVRSYEFLTDKVTLPPEQPGASAASAKKT